MICFPCIQRIASFFTHSLFVPRTSLPRHSIFAFMSSQSDDSYANSTHLERTESSERQEIIAQASVTEITQLSQSVKGLHLKVEDPAFTFKPGQWVDFFIPGLSTVGGFSICSSPKKLKEKSIIELAVKYSEHPPAFWIHNECHVGDKVQVRVGGSFYFDPLYGNANMPDLLLIAGGVGINPLYSIVRHVADNCSDLQVQENYTGKTMVLFSAKSTDELLFKDSLLEMSSRCPSIRCRFFTTNHETAGHNIHVSADNRQILHGRINETSIQEAISDLDRSHLTCYICGPPPMIKDVTDILRKLDINEHRIHFEKWW